jgi:hypothetical protein
VSLIAFNGGLSIDHGDGLLPSGNSTLTVIAGQTINLRSVIASTDGNVYIGNISVFTDEDVDVAQSRIMTEQGGDIVMWSSNGSIDAGKGAKTSYSLPAPASRHCRQWKCSAIEAPMMIKDSVEIPPGLQRVSTILP